MDIKEVRKRVGKRLGIIGNIRVHTLATGSKQQIQDLVMDIIKNYGMEGGYALGSSNSIPNYVPLENYLTMLETNSKYGWIKQGI